MSNGLAGVRVVDFGHHIAGPMAALLLADAGAEVVHIDRPRGTAAANVTDAFLHRGKRRATLDLKSPADVDLARGLIRSADVVIENFRPGVMDRLGLGAGPSLAANARLIYCSLPGFAADDERANVRAWEGILHAASAGYRPLNEHWDPSGRRYAQVDDEWAPLFTPVTTASNFGAMLGATMVAAALIGRERSGRGQRIELPLVEAMIEAYSTMMRNHVYDNARGAAGTMLSDLSYRCADGGMIDLSPHPKFVLRLLTAAGVADEWQRLGLVDLDTGTFSLELRERIQAEFAALIATRTASEWDALAMVLKTPMAMVRTPAQWLASDHARESGAVLEVDDPTFGSVVMPGPAFELGATPAPGDAPRTMAAGVHRAEPIERPLHGVRVLELTQAVAGPTAARLLADLGADVIKVGSTTPGVTDGIVGHLHRGKRTILLDSSGPDGRCVLDRLVQRADALVTNFMPAAASKYGVDEERLASVNPQLVHCSISAYGCRGPWAERRAYENQCNAATGMSQSYGAPFGWTL
ncbi:MAG TPA: CoA transferase, partial [Ilumatobacteraceae bacterium]